MVDRKRSRLDAALAVGAAAVAGDATVSLSPFRISNDELTIHGAMAVLNSFGAATDLMAAGSIDTAPLLGRPLSLAQFPDALERVRTGEGIKTQVDPRA